MRRQMYLSVWSQTICVLQHSWSLMVSFHLMKVEDMYWEDSSAVLQDMEDCLESKASSWPRSHRQLLMSVKMVIQNWKRRKTLSSTFWFRKKINSARQSIRDFLFWMIWKRSWIRKAGKYLQEQTLSSYMILTDSLLTWQLRFWKKKASQ